MDKFSVTFISLRIHRSKAFDWLIGLSSRLKISVRFLTEILSEAA